MGLRSLLVACALAMLGAKATAAELIMIEEAGCVWCAKWNADIGHIYPRTSEGAYAPLRRIDKGSVSSAKIEFASRPVYTPTFILVEDGREIGRIEGYPGEDFFWALLEKILIEKTSYERPSS